MYKQDDRIGPIAPIAWSRDQIYNFHEGQKKRALKLLEMLFQSLLITKYLDHKGVQYIRNNGLCLIIV